jgi:hypothetical protein
MNTPNEPIESLTQARLLLRELINLLELDAGGSTAAALTRVLVHVENIQKSIEQSSEDLTNGVKRLRDFANTLGRLHLDGESLSRAGTTRVKAVDTLRLAADQLRAHAAEGAVPA